MITKSNTEILNNYKIAQNNSRDTQIECAKQPKRCKTTEMQYCYKDTQNYTKMPNGQGFLPQATATQGHLKHSKTRKLKGRPSFCVSFFVCVCEECDWLIKGGGALSFRYLMSVQTSASRVQQLVPTSVKLEEIVGVKHNPVMCVCDASFNLPKG